MKSSLISAILSCAKAKAQRIHTPSLLLRHSSSKAVSCLLLGLCLLWLAEPSHNCPSHFLADYKLHFEPQCHLSLLRLHTPYASTSQPILTLPIPPPASPPSTAISILISNIYCSLHTSQLSQVHQASQHMLIRRRSFPYQNGTRTIGRVSPLTLCTAPTPAAADAFRLRVSLVIFLN